MPSIYAVIKMELLFVEASRNFQNPISILATTVVCLILKVRNNVYVSSLVICKVSVMDLACILYGISC